MNYKESIDYLETLRPKEFRMELEPMKRVCHDFDDPQLAIPSIHISGTNGKGSTAAFCEALLRGSGYRVGLFTSPHLLDVRERMQIDRKPISESDFSKLVQKIKCKLSGEDTLSYFEFLTLLGFLYFKENKVDIVIYETGLGGRLDATNVIEPKVSIITSLSLDHTHHLGNKISEIAYEKCGIIKRGVPTVVAQQQVDAMEIVMRTCDDVGSPLIVANPEEMKFKIGLLGEHQRQNAACAFQAIALLENSGFNIKDQENSLMNTKWAGRLDRVVPNPNIILDGAHNPGGAKALASYLRDNLSKNKTVIMLGILADKDVKEIVKHIAPLAREVVCVSAPSSRSSSPKDIAAMVRSYGVKVHIEDDVDAALKKWIGKLATDDTLIVTGSFFTVGAAMQYFSKRTK